MAWKFIDKVKDHTNISIELVEICKTSPIPYWKVIVFINGSEIQNLCDYIYDEGYLI